jgi:SNF2 family DNA or RNA helicase
MTDVKYGVKNKGDRPFLVCDIEVPGFKQHRNGFYFAPLTMKYRRLLSEATGKPPVKMTQGYHWPRPPGINPYPQQKETAEFILTHLRGWILNEMRSGKTLSTCWALDRLFNMKLIKKVLILSPLSIMRNVWQQETFSVMPHKAVFIADDSVDDVHNKLTYLHQDIVVLNHDKLRLCDELLDLWNPDIIIVDEAGGFRSMDSARVDSLTYLLTDDSDTKHRQFRRFMALTATPCPQSPLDLYPLGSIINPSVLPPTFKSFRDRVMYTIKPKNKGGSKARTFYKPKPNIEPYIQSCLVPAMRVRTRDCIDLPETIYSTRKVAYTPVQKKALTQMLRDNRTLITDVVTGNTQNITAANAAVALGKYLQICGGVVLREAKISGAQTRLQEIKSILTELGPAEKTIIMCGYTSIQSYLISSLTASGYESVLMNGTLTTTQREESMRRFRNDPDVKVMVLHPTVGKWGLNLSAANTTIWYLPVYSADEYIQGNARMLAKKSSTKQQTGVIQISGGAIETMLYGRISERASFQETVVSAFNHILEQAA